jgi:hypothetical protein
MKKFIAIIIIVVSLNLQSQSVRVGVSTGFLSAKYTTDFNNEKTTNNKIEYYGGFSFDYKLSNKFTINHQILYFNANRLMVPILVKYYVSEKISLLAGPQIIFELQKTPDLFNKVNYGASIGASYDFDKNFAIQLGYFMQLNNFYNGDIDLTSRTNYLNIGYIFKF